MNYTDYRNEVLNDAINAIDEQFDNGYWDENTQWDEVYDNLFVDDAVTGNGSGSYTFNREKSRENVADAIWDDRILQALDNIGCDSEQLAEYLRDNDPEGIDVTIRCAMLGEVYSEIEKHFSDRVFDCE